jgi:MFS family permease
MAGPNLEDFYTAASIIFGIPSVLYIAGRLMDLYKSKIGAILLVLTSIASMITVIFVSVKYPMLAFFIFALFLGSVAGLMESCSIRHNEKN